MKPAFLVQSRKDVPQTQHRPNGRRKSPRICHFSAEPSFGTLPRYAVPDFCSIVPLVTIDTRKSYCRICTAYCALDVDIDAGRVQAVAR